MEELRGLIQGPYGPLILSGDRSYLCAKGEIRRLLDEIEASGKRNLIVGNPERQPWQRYCLSSVEVVFTSSGVSKIRGVLYATNVRLAENALLKPSQLEELAH